MKTWLALGKTRKIVTFHLNMNWHKIHKESKINICQVLIYHSRNWISSKWNDLRSKLPKSFSYMQTWLWLLGKSRAIFQNKLSLPSPFICTEIFKYIWSYFARHTFGHCFGFNQFFLWYILLKATSYFQDSPEIQTFTYNDKVKPIMIFTVE